MTHAIDNDLAKTIARYATDGTAAQQLRRLPSFELPDDMPQIFEKLLADLDRVVLTTTSRS